MIPAGRRREIIRIESKNVTRDAFGAEVVTWTTKAGPLRAEVQPIAGREYIALRQAQSEISLRMRLRYVSGITSDMRAVWKENPYNIVEAIDVGARGRQLELLCRGDSLGG